MDWSLLYLVPLAVLSALFTLWLASAFLLGIRNMWRRGTPFAPPQVQARPPKPAVLPPSQHPRASWSSVAPDTTEQN